MELFRKFINVFTHEKDTYVNAARVNDTYRKQKRGSTQKSMTIDLNLDYVNVYKKGLRAGEFANIDIENVTSWSTINVYVKLHQLSSNKKLYKAIKALRDVPKDQVILKSSNQDESDTESIADNAKDDDIREAEDVASKATGGAAEGSIATHVGNYIALPNLVKLLLDNRKDYTVEEDYVFHEVAIGAIEKTSGKRDHNTVYLTLVGFIRVVVKSRAGNDNLVRAFDWIANLVFVAKFGSDEERRELTRNLFSHTLNEKTSGLYFVEIGCLSDLYDSMQIDKTLYPSDGEYRVAKFGQAEHIPARITDHKSEAAGYGRWSKTVEYRWSVRLAPSQLNAAERLLQN
ncbi:hypothetical protein V7S43_000157 [Phytophthora oleae]|uniref:Uncharacterized protein n=1 Tax=Phytophthora oleae TaxID=2107226 RepID=A0ABD3G7M9_9STRA